MKHICFFGDGVTQGVGDRHHFGWPERLAVLEQMAIHKSSVLSSQGAMPLSEDGVTAYSLGVTWDTSVDIRLRWRDEAFARLTNRSQAGVVFCFGLVDMTSTDEGGLTTSLWDSTSHAEALILEAANEWPVLWVGPPPISCKTDPVTVQGVTYHFSAARLQALNDAYANIAARNGIPYLNLIATLSADKRWAKAQKQGDGVFPSSIGHQLIAETMSRWQSWRRWMDRGVGGGTVSRAKQLPPYTLLTPKLVAAGY